MSKMTKAVSDERISQKIKKEMVDKKAVTNFMGGISYELNPLDTLKILTASSIFGEPQYYRDGEFKEKNATDGVFYVDRLFANYIIDGLDKYEGKKTSEIMEEAIDAALDYDFKATLDWAVTLRKDYFMRLNPQVIAVRAAIHPKRQEFTKENPSYFAQINNLIMSRADEPASQLTYYLYRNKSKKNIPGILKRSWASKYNQMSKRDIYKYRNSGMGMIDTIRICHASSDAINELMTTGTVVIEEENKTWENLRASGKPWKEILTTINIGHMALLRNLRGIFSEIEDYEFAVELMKKLKAGVLKGKQFPFRYQSAFKEIEKSNIHHKQLVLDTLEECMDIACDNLPKLKGKTMCLSDNSGSAWGNFNSEFGSVTVADIDNLSSVIAAKNSDEGYVGKFGDRLKVFNVSKRKGVLEQSKAISEEKYSDVGCSTENGIWIFFRDAIKNKEHFDNIFIFSDQQAGHGGLYGTPAGIKEYTQLKFDAKGTYVDVAKLISEYRKNVNPKVNVFSVQTAGYTNVLVPENGYRTSILYGWTGKELLYAETINKFWDEKDIENNK